MVWKPYDFKANELDVQRWSSLHRATANGFIEASSILLDQCSELLNLQSQPQMTTPLMAAAGPGHATMVLHLLDIHSADVALKDKNDHNAVYIAANSGQDSEAACPERGRTEEVECDQRRPPQRRLAG